MNVISDLKKPGKRYFICARAIGIKNKTYSDKKLQEGFLEDHTGKIKFKVWNDAKIELLQEGIIYEITKARFGVYKNNLELNFDSQTERLSENGS